MKAVVLQCEELSIGYRQRGGRRSLVAEDLNLALHAGELVCLLGGNGVGKSTLLRTLCGLHAPLAGRVLLKGRPMDRLSPGERARLLSVVLTDRPLAGHLAVSTLVGLGRYPYTGVAGRISAEDRRMVTWALEAVNGGHLAERYYDELSDGERQKVMIARALAQDPAVLLLDEPTAFLDLTQRMEITRHLRDLARETGRAALLTTHDVDLALRAADRIWLMGRGGKMLAGAPEDLILDGSLPAAFADEHVVFDELLGAFRLHEEGGEHVLLEGEGRALCWTGRALRRAGFHLAGEGAPAVYRVVVAAGAGGSVWSLYAGGAEQRHGSILELIDGLRAAAGGRVST